MTERNYEKINSDLSIDKLAFAKVEKVNKTSELKENRFNLKILSSDLQLIDMLAEFHQVSRSAIVNKLLFNALKRELLDITDMGPDGERRSAIDVVAEIAVAADQQMKLDPLELPWVLDIPVLRQRFVHEINRVRAYGEYNEQFPYDPHSSIYETIVKKLKG